MKTLSKIFVRVVDFVIVHSISLLILMFLVVCFTDFAFKQIFWLVIITLVTLSLCESKFKLNVEPIKYFNVLFFFSTWVGLLLFFFWGFLYYYALCFPMLELSPEAQGVVVQGLNWRALLQLALNIGAISLIIILNLEDKPKKQKLELNEFEEQPGEGRFARKVRVRVMRKMWIWTHRDWIDWYTYVVFCLLGAIGCARTFNIKVPYIIQYTLVGYLLMNWGLFFLVTFLRVVYIAIKTTLREEEIAARKKK